MPCGPCTRRAAPTLIVAAGDLCVDGPKPKKVLQRLEEVGAQCVRGNTDRYLSETRRRSVAGEDEAQLDWTRRDLGERYLDWLRELPFAMRIGEDDNQLLVVHANPHERRRTSVAGCADADSANV